MGQLFEKQKYYAAKDEYILSLYKSDPKAAFSLMFETYHKALCLYAVQLTDSFSLAEDIVQDLYVSIWEKRLYLKISKNLRGYLFLSVRNNTYAILKKNSEVSMEELFDIKIDYTQTFFEDDELDEQERKINEELKKLPKQELTAITLVIIKGKKYKEAATEMDISVNTLKTYLSRALKRLRSLDAFILLF